MLPIVPGSKKLLIVAMVGLLAACGGAEERKAKYMDEGKQLFTAGDYQKAQLSFKNVLQIDPKDVEARYQMAEALSKLGEIQNAVGQYMAVIGEDPKHLMSRLRMGQIFLMVNKPEDAEKMAKEVQVIDPENIEGKVLMAGVYILKNNTDAAMVEIDAALKKQPDDVQANLLLASLNIRTGKIDQAIEILKKSSDKNPTNPAPMLMLAKVYTETKALDKAQQTLEAIIKIQPKQLEHRKRLALFLLADNQLDKSEAILRTAVQELPDDVAAKSMLIEFLVAKRTPEIAIAELLPMIAQNPDKYDLRFMLADLELAQKNNDKAEQTLKEIADLDKLGPQSIKARNKLAAIYVATKRVDEAKALVKQIIEENPRDLEALSLRGKFALAERKIPEAIGDFRAVLVDQPQNVAILKLLTTAHLMNKDLVLARENMEKIIEIAPKDETARLDLANLLQQTGDTDRALQQVNALLEENPKSKVGLEAAFKIYLTQKKWDKAQEAASHVQEAFPEEGMGYFLSGLAFQAEGKIDKSIPAFESALAKQSEAIEPLTQLIKSYLALKQTDKALVKLTSITKQQPKNFIAYNLMGGVYLSDKKYSDATDAFKKASTIKPEWPIPYRMMAMTYGIQGNKAEAIKIYQEGIVNTKSSMELVNDLATIYNKSGEHDKAIAVFDEAYKLHPESTEALNNLASYLSDYAKDSTELERAAKLAEPLAKVDNPNTLDTVAWIAYKQGNYAKAQELLLKVIALDAGSAISNYHLGMTYYKQNDTAKAREFLQKSIESKVEFTGLDVAKETIKLIDSASPVTK
ncbi:tetratricopeptide repeat protein [Methylobacter psychrophilus]|uniref:tetratricopeptide repeat protein n=1 Tax=Methylobacter psychrophilus TaxID=96941 RepID=UPI0021D4E777|nr:tetratricopeptide repeat protein [Methylobacter psychrophilus]